MKINQSGSLFQVASVVPGQSFWESANCMGFITPLKSSKILVWLRCLQLLTPCMHSWVGLRGKIWVKLRCFFSEKMVLCSQNSDHEVKNYFVREVLIRVWPPVRFWQDLCHKAQESDFAARHSAETQFPCDTLVKSSLEPVFKLNRSLG